MEAIYKIKNKKNFNYYSKNIKKFLIDKFLYERDSESINILLNIYNIEESIENVYPSYVSLKYLKLDIIKFLKDKEGKELIANNLSNLIHDDINRLELYIYLEGYKKGLKSLEYVNILECYFVNYFKIDDLYNKRKLFMEEIKNVDILRLKRKVINDIKNDVKTKKNMINIIYNFNNHLLKEKINNLNRNIDRQLKFDLDSTENIIKETNSYLSYAELRGLNRKIIKFLFSDCYRVFENAYWNGVNDKVIKRYR